MQKSVIYQNNYWINIKNIKEYFNVKIELLRDNLLKIKVYIMFMAIYAYQDSLNLFKFKKIGEIKKIRNYSNKKLPAIQWKI